MRSTCTHFHVERLHNSTALLGPIILQREDHTLKGFDVVFLHSQVRAILLSELIKNNTEVYPDIP
ncbi:Uncharacterised protein [Vibrio cholerae]|nr:Uncharacterised protein [Vibrio cholerae]